MLMTRDGKRPARQPKAKAKANQPMPTAKKLQTGTPAEVPIDKIFRHPRNPRADATSGTAELGESLERDGLLQRPVVRPTGRGDFELIAGARRFLAAKAKGYKTIPVEIREMDDATAIQVLCLENMHRENLNAIERATAMQLLATPTADGGAGMTVKQVAELLGRSVNGVRHYLSLLRFPPHWRDLIARNEVAWNKALYIAPHAEQPQVLAAIERDLKVHPEQWVGQEATVARIGEIAESFGVLKRSEKNRRRLEECTPEAMAGQTARGMEEIGAAFGASATIVRDWKRRGAPIRLAPKGKKDGPENDLAAIAAWLQENNAPAGERVSAKVLPETDAPAAKKPDRRAAPVRTFAADDAAAVSPETTQGKPAAERLLRDVDIQQILTPYADSPADLQAIIDVATSLLLDGQTVS